MADAELPRPDLADEGVEKSVDPAPDVQVLDAFLPRGHLLALPAGQVEAAGLCTPVLGPSAGRSCAAQVALLEQPRLAAQRAVAAPGGCVAVSQLQPKMEQVMEVQQPRRVAQAVQRVAEAQLPTALAERPASRREVQRPQAAGPRTVSALLLASMGPRAPELALPGLEAPQRVWPQQEALPAEEAA